MFDLQNFIIESHLKIIGHYTQLLNSATSESERERYRRCIEEQDQSLQRLCEEQSKVRRAA